MDIGTLSSSEKQNCIKCGKKTSHYRTIHKGSITIQIADCDNCTYDLKLGGKNMENVLSLIKSLILS